jgi:hypothetical protein
LKSLKFFVLIFLFFSFELLAFDSNRPFTARLAKHARSRFDEYELPFLQVASGATYTFDADTLVKKVRQQLGKSRLSIRGHFSKASGDANASNVPLPKEITKGNQLEAVQSCTPAKCNMKLSDKEEKEKVAKATDKLATYHQLVVDRLNRYLKKNELVGYDDRTLNHTTVRKMLHASKFFEPLYPKEASFFDSGFWKGQLKPATLIDSFLRGEMVVLAPDRMQPIWRISEVFEFKEKSTHLFVEIHIYTNHYFDASLRVLEVLPMPGDPKRSILVITDITEIDELKKSALIRTLYTGKMVEAVMQSQDEIIDGLES